MKALRYILGALGGAFAAVHVVYLIRKVTEGSTAGYLTTSMYAGNVVGICVGLLVAILCFRRR